MRMLTKLSLPALLLCLGATATAGDRVAADGDRHRPLQGQLLVAQNDCPSLNEAVERVRRQYNGRIVSAETRVSGNREVHYIKVLTDDGKVKTVTVPGCARRS
jgi:uncharacterized membrane protein YkoI